MLQRGRRLDVMQGLPVARPICCARTVVKVAGICCAITIGHWMDCGSAASIVSKAWGPPVELPMAMMRGRRVAPLRS